MQGSWIVTTAPPEKGVISWCPELCMRAAWLSGCRAFRIWLLHVYIGVFVNRDYVSGYWKRGLVSSFPLKKNGWLQSFLNIEWLNPEFSWFQYYIWCPRIGMIGFSRARRDWDIALSASILQMGKPSLDKTLNPFKFSQGVRAKSHVFWFSVHFSVIITCLLLTSSSS